MKFSNKAQTFIIVAVLILIAGALRLISFGTVPPSPDWDEASLGYNAYSILHTGRDEYGQFLPIVLRSFDDYKPALYAYLIIPFLFIFGLTIQAVRMPSVIFGVITIVTVFFLCEDLFQSRKYAFLIAFLLAISPWHVQFSRIGFESQVGLSLNIIGLFLFIKGLRKQSLLLGSAISFAATIYVYQSEKVFVPLFLVLIVIAFLNKVKNLSKKYLVASIIAFFILCIPMGWYLLSNPSALARAKGVSVFSDNTQITSTSLRIAKDAEHKDYVGLVFDNRRIVYVKEVVANYLSHFDLKWLFITGDVSRHHAPFMGLLYLWDLPFLLFGIYGFLFSKFSPRTKLLIFGWFFLAPIPASVTTGVPHAVRTLNFLPTWQIFIAYGVLEIMSFAKETFSNKLIRMGFLGLIGLILIFNFVYYIDQYFVQQNYYNSMDWQYGYEQAVPFVDSLRAKQVIVTNQPPLDQSYMFFLFYLRYNPVEYQIQTNNTSGGFRETHQFGKYSFRPIIWRNESRNTDTVYIGRPSDFPQGVDVLKVISYLNGSPAIEIIK